MKILGLSSWFHDSCACLLLNEDIVGYVEEERFNRDKHTPAFPDRSIDWALSAGGIGVDDLDEVVYYVHPLKYLRVGISAALTNFPQSLGLAKKGAATMSPFRRLANMARLKSIVAKGRGRGDFRVRFVDHYRTHQASTYYPSGYEDAAILTMDIAADGATEVIAHGRGNRIEDRLKHRIPSAFGLVFSTVTHFIGYNWYDEYKVMGMAAYGEPRFADNIRRLFRFDENSGDMALDLKYFNFHIYGRSHLFSPAIVELLGQPRLPGAELTQRDYDIAASLQQVTSEYGVAMARLAKRLTGSKTLCMAGGVAQNCLMNQAICESGLFENVFLQPLSSDAGCALGAPLFSAHHIHDRPRRFVQRHLYLGPSYDDAAQPAIAAAGLVERPSTDWAGEVAGAIADGLVVGFFNGRMEAGPRALGSRSILADPRRAEMKDILNLRVKHREHFRPFAPSVLGEHVDTVFEPLPACRSLDYMIVTMTVRPEWRERVPTITHHDETARVQAVRKEYAPDYYEIISRFHALTGVPLVVNTSFNDNEPVVCQPEHAIACFLRTQIDLLVIGRRLFYREDNLHAVAARPEAL